MSTPGATSSNRRSREGRRVIGFLFCILLLGPLPAADTPGERNASTGSGGQVRKWKQERDAANQALQKNNYALAEQHYLAAAKAAEGFEIKDRRRVEGLSELADFYIQFRRYEEAESLCRQALALREQTVGTNHLDVAAVLLQLGQACRFQGKLSEAEGDYVRARRITETKVGAFHPAVAYSLHGLGLVCMMQDRYREAEEHFKAALKIMESPGGHVELTQSGDLVRYERRPDYGVIAGAVNDFALLYARQGKWDDAEKLLQKSLASNERQFGKNSAQLSAPLHNLAYLYLEQTNYARAKIVLNRALGIEEKATGPGHPVRMETLYTLIWISLQEQNLAEAARLHGKLLGGRSADSEGEKPTLEAIGLALAGQYGRQGKHAQAEQLLLRMLKSVEQSHGAEHIQVARVLNRLGEIQTLAGKRLAAESAYRRSLAIQEKVVGVDDVSVCTTLRTLANLCQARKNNEEADALCRRQTQIMEKAFGPNDPRVRNTLEDHAGLLRKMGREADAAALESRAKSIR